MSAVTRQLNRLLEIHACSLPMYMLDAGSWASQAPKDSELLQAMNNIVIGNKNLSQKIAATIMDLGGVVSSPTFPMVFTDMNFLSLDYMAREVLALQIRDLAEIEKIVWNVSSNADAKAVAQEALGEAKAHMEALDTILSKQPV
jgi:hypothetical protein